MRADETNKKPNIIWLILGVLCILLVLALIFGHFIPLHTTVDTHNITIDHPSNPIGLMGGKINRTH
jgi:hypothetical protein